MSAEIAFIGRATKFSPGSADKDAAILSAVRQRLAEKGFACQDVVPEDHTVRPHADVYVTMGRHAETLQWLSAEERQQRLVVNSTASVLLCNHRQRLMQQLEQTGIPVAPRQGDHGYWVKRGVGCREQADDVQFVPDYQTARQVCETMHRRGISEVEIRAHVPGCWVKFYGVGGTDFFRCYRQEEPLPPAFDERALQQLAARAAELAGVAVYGGDCIVRSDGQPVLIDLNDWPSFSPCRDEAAEAIARYIIYKV